MVHSQTKNDHLERISLRSAGLAPGAEHVSALVESKQHRWDFVALRSSGKKFCGPAVIKGKAEAESWKIGAMFADIREYSELRSR